MRISDDELLELIDELSSALGELLVSHRELAESFMASNGLEQAKDQIEKKRQEIEKLREKLRKSKDALKRKRDLERLRKANDSSRRKGGISEGAEQIRDSRGRLVGWRVKERGKTTYLDRKGGLAAREHDGRTYDKNGAFYGFGSQGLRLLASCPKAS